MLTKNQIWDQGENQYMLTKNHLPIMQRNTYITILFKPKLDWKEQDW